MELDGYRRMWTAGAAKYVLVGDAEGYLPVDVSGPEPMAVLIDEEDDLANAVIEK